MFLEWRKNVLKHHLEELIKKLERAIEADRELDRDIGLTCLGWRVVEYEGHDALEIGNVTYPDDPGATYPSPTESIEDALKMVPEEECHWTIFSQNVEMDGNVIMPSAYVSSYGVDDSARTLSDGATPAIALCIAALKWRLK